MALRENGVIGELILLMKTVLATKMCSCASETNICLIRTQNPFRNMWRQIISYIYYKKDWDLLFHNSCFISLNLTISYTLQSYQFKSKKKSKIVKYQLAVTQHSWNVFTNCNWRKVWFVFQCFSATSKNTYIKIRWQVFWEYRIILRIKSNYQS